MKRTFAIALIATLATLMFSPDTYASSAAGLSQASMGFISLAREVGGILTGELARWIAIIGLALVGIGMIFMENGVHKLLKVCVGLVIIVSSQAIVSRFMVGSAFVI